MKISYDGNVVGITDSSQAWGPNDRVGTLARPLDVLLGDDIRCTNGQVYFSLKPGSPALTFGGDSLFWWIRDSSKIADDICGNSRKSKCKDSGSFQQSNVMLGKCCTTFREDIFYNLAFSLYPNPTASRFTVRLAAEPKGLKAELFDLTGRNVLSAPLTEKETKLNTENLTAGIYLLKIGTRTAKLIKE